MEKSNIEKVKDALLFAPVGAFGFVKDNAPTFFSMFVSRGKRDVAKTTNTAEEKISSTKEHGQIVAMGTPLVKEKADKLATQAKGKGEQVVQISLDVALGAIGLLEGVVKTVTSTVSGTKATPRVEQPEIHDVAQAANPPSEPIRTESVDQAYSTKDLQGSIAPKQEWIPTIEEDVEYDHIATPYVQSETVQTHEPTFIPDSFDPIIAGEGTFIAEPVDPLLPDRIRAEYEVLSAPEIIDRLDEFEQNDLQAIRNFEEGSRNRQTIIHAINYRLDEKL